MEFNSHSIDRIRDMLCRIKEALADSPRLLHEARAVSSEATLVNGVESGSSAGAHDVLIAAGRFMNQIDAFTNEIGLCVEEFMGEVHRFQKQANDLAGSQAKAIVRAADMMNQLQESRSSLMEEINERLIVERELHAAKEVAEDTARAKNEFLARISHELLTPMNGIIGMTDLVLDSTLTAQQHRYLTLARGSADSLLTIILDLLDYSHMVRGNHEQMRSDMRFSLQKLLTESLDAKKHQALAKGIELNGRIQADVPDRLRGEPNLLGKVLGKLIDNAIKFTEQGSVSVEVGLRDAANPRVRLQFTVQDTGIGIPVDKQLLIFDPFEQADGSMCRNHGGAGLGLTIASQLVSMLGGEIGVESTPDQGSTFHFTACFHADAESLSRTIDPQAI